MQDPSPIQGPHGQKIEYPKHEIDMGIDRPASHPGADSGQEQIDKRPGGGCRQLLPICHSTVPYHLSTDHCQLDKLYSVSGPLYDDIMPHLMNGTEEQHRQKELLAIQKVDPGQQQQKPGGNSELPKLKHGTSVQVIGRIQPERTIFQFKVQMRASGNSGGSDLRNGISPLDHVPLIHAQLAAMGIE